MLVIGVAGTELTAQERDWLQHDACAGVILFTRNFASRQQVAELELESADAGFERPDWLGREVTDSTRYYNLALATRPYSQWSQAERDGSAL